MCNKTISNLMYTYGSVNNETHAQILVFKNTHAKIFNW